MLSTRQKAVYLGTSGAAAATFVWLRYAESASSARRFLGEAGRGAGKKISGIYETLAKVRRRVVAFDRILSELVRAASERKDRAEMVFNNTLGRLEETTAVIQNNLTQSSNEITALIKDIRSAVSQSALPKPSQAA